LVWNALHLCRTQRSCVFKAAHLQTTQRRCVASILQRQSILVSNVLHLCWTKLRCVPSQSATADWLDVRCNAFRNSTASLCCKSLCSSGETGVENS
jgi:hypothetical protein